MIIIIYFYSCHYYTSDTTEKSIKIIVHYIYVWGFTFKPSNNLVKKSLLLRPPSVRRHIYTTKTLFKFSTNSEKWFRFF